MTSDDDPSPKEMNYQKLQNLVNSRAVKCQPWPRQQKNPSFSTGKQPQNPLKKVEIFGSCARPVQPQGAAPPPPGRVELAQPGPWGPPPTQSQGQDDFKPIKAPKKVHCPIKTESPYSSVTWFPLTNRFQYYNW